MGQGKSGNQFNVCTLNYSGIFLSPFEFYGMDNWRELQDIGKLFEEKLRERYQGYKLIMEHHKWDTSKWSKVYERKKFKWEIGKLDKKVHWRYTPIKVQEKDIEKGIFPGIDPIEQWKFETEEQFLQSWDRRLDNIIDRVIEVPAEAEDEAFVSSNAERQACKLFDYLNYESIVHYIYNYLKNHPDPGRRLNEEEEVSDLPSHRSNRSAQSQRERRQSRRVAGGWFKSKGNIIDYICRLPQAQQRKLTDSYKRFMKKVFEVINLNRKRELTVEHMFKMDIVFLQEVTQPLKQILNEKNQQLSIQGKDPFQILLSQDSESIVLMRGSLPFLKKSVYEGYDYNAQTAVKRELEEYLKNEVIEDFVQKWNENVKNFKKDDQIQQITKYQSKLKKNPLFWFSQCILAEYRQGNHHYVIGNFHLSSKAGKNAVEVELLGAILFWLNKTRPNAKFIFGGDFNSYVAVEEKEDPHGLFTYVKKSRELQIRANETRFKDWKKTVNIYPNHRKMNTTNKKRTILQPQAKKINDLKTTCIDQIITNFPILYESSSVGQIKQVNYPGHRGKSLIPYDRHPYDHFVVKATLTVPERARQERVDRYQEDEMR